MALTAASLHRQRHRAAERERSRHAPDAHVDHGAGRGAAESMGPQAGRRLRRSRHAGRPPRHRRADAAAAADAAAPSGADHAERRLHLSRRRGRVARRRSAVPRPAEYQNAEDRAPVPLDAEIARIVRRAAERRDDALPDALRDAEGRAELLHPRRRGATPSAPSRSSRIRSRKFRDILRQYVTYKRKDGVTLSGTLYLPPGYKQGTKVPVIMWAYPREFGDADSASQVSGSPNQFTLRSAAPRTCSCCSPATRSSTTRRCRSSGRARRRTTPTSSSSSPARRRRSTRSSRWASPIAIASASAATATAGS